MKQTKIIAPSLLSLIILLSGCGGSSDSSSSDSTTSTSDSSTADTSNTNSSGTTTSGWVMNTTNEVSTELFENGNTDILVNVQSVTAETISNADYTLVKATGIAAYQVTMTQDIIDTLNNRPKASTDFPSGTTTANVGDVVEFGADIGYNSNSNCTTTGGDGYWPPGPECPENVSHEGYFPNAPTPATSGNEATGLGAVGYWVNGTSVYQWSDGQSYNSAGVWQNLAAVAEVYDVDICGGHAANGDYHHHFSSTCLGDLVGDKGDAHSPIYGYAADGYPIHGPWYADGVLVLSSWAVRDYDTANSATGCSVAGVRDCQLVNQYDISEGVQTVSTGPSTSDQETSLSGNVFNTTAGFYFEDHYWDSTLAAAGGAYVDQYNGHDHDDLGYHYHVTITMDGSGTISPAFPYTVGPYFYGEIQSNSIVSSTSSGPTGPRP